MTIPQEHMEEKKMNSWQRFLSYDYAIVSKNLQFILFVLAMIITYIYNGHLYEKKIRSITKELKEMHEIEYEYKNLSEQWNYKTKESEIEKKLKNRGLYIPNTPPYIIRKK